MSTVETKLRTIMANALPASSDKSWPEHMEPLPSARLSLAMIALKQGKPVPALRNVLRGKFLTTRQIDGPEWVNEMMDVVTVLMVGGSLPPDAAAFEDKSFPAVEDIRTVTYGYLWAMVRGAERAFGKGVGYVRVVRELMGAVLGKKKGGAAPGSREFWEREFEAAQGKVLGWAGVPVERGVKVVDE
jgi:SET and MYND domain-containing protein